MPVRVADVSVRRAGTARRARVVVEERPDRGDRADREGAGGLRLRADAVPAGEHRALVGRRGQRERLAVAVLTGADGAAVEIAALTRPLPVPPRFSWNWTSIVVGSSGRSASSPSNGAPTHVVSSSTVIVHVDAFVGSQPGFQSSKVSAALRHRQLDLRSRGELEAVIGVVRQLVVGAVPAGRIRRDRAVAVPSDSLTPSRSGSKTATIDVASSSSVNAQSPVPGQSGVLQEDSFRPASLLAVSFTWSPRSYVSVHESWSEFVRAVAEASRCPAVSRTPCRGREARSAGSRRPKCGSLTQTRAPQAERP